MNLTARYWKDPHKFMPERFLGDWPRDAFIPFSLGMTYFVLIHLSMTQVNTVGARACVGRRYELSWYHWDQPQHPHVKLSGSSKLSG
jgi:cytochrome P450